MKYVFPERKHRFQHGDLIYVEIAHWIWNDNKENIRVERGDILIFLKAYGFNANECDWMRSKWNLCVFSHKFGIIYVIDEYVDEIR